MKERTRLRLLGGTRLCALGPLVLLAGCAASLAADEGQSASLSFLGDVQVPVRSVEDLRFASVVRQRYDFSCGSAALATLLRYHYGGTQNEGDTFRGMWAKGDRQQIRRLGFSLLDMKRYLASLGVAAGGYQVSLDDIVAAGVPGIALINVNGYKHFVVVKGVGGHEVLVGDPALGLRTMTTNVFKAAWNGIYFVLDSKLADGRASFNGDRQWVEFARAPIGGAFGEPVSRQALMLTNPALGDF